MTTEYLQIKKEVEGLYNAIHERDGKGEIVQLDEFNTIEAIKNYKRGEN
jgi:hypothetical protein